MWLLWNAMILFIHNNIDCIHCFSHHLFLDFRYFYVYFLHVFSFLLSRETNLPQSSEGIWCSTADQKLLQCGELTECANLILSGYKVRSEVLQASGGKTTCLWCCCGCVLGGARHPGARARVCKRAPDGSHLLPATPTGQRQVNIKKKNKSF